MSLKKYIKELKRRNVFKSGIAYLIVAWLIAQVASIVLPTFNAPPYVMKTLLFILGIGFPLNLVFAWVYDITPDGIKKTENFDQKSILKSGRLNKVIIASLSIAIVLLLFNQFWSTASNEINKVDSIEIIEPIGALEKSIAVLPLHNLNQKDENLEYFSDGVTQEIIYELAKIKTFSITAFTTSLSYKKSEKEQHEIAKELDVNYLVSGTSRIFDNGNRVKIFIELFNPISKKVIWAETFEEDLDGSTSIQLLVAKNIVEILDIDLTSSEKIALNIKNTESGEAFRLFLKAKAEIFKMTPDGFESTRKILTQALELDPNYAQAHTLMAWNLILQGGSWFKGDNRSTEETIALALPHIEKSIHLNPSSSDIYLIRANLNLHHRGLLRDAKSDVDYALEVNSWPRVPTDYCICTVVATYSALGDITKAKELAVLGGQVDPGNVFISFDQALIFMLYGEMKKAQKLLEKSVKIVDIPYFNFYLGWSYYHDNEFEKALPYFEKAYQFGEKSIAFNVAYLSNTYRQLGDQNKSNQYFNELLDRLKSGENHINLPLAMVFAAQNNVEETLTRLEMAQNDKEYAFAYMINTDLIFRPFHKEPRFIELRKKVQYYE